MEEMVRTLFIFAFVEGASEAMVDAEKIANAAEGIYTSISSALVAVGISLVVLFWLIELLTRAINYQERNFGWEQMTMMVVKLVFAKYIVQYSSKILGFIKDIGEMINSTIGSAGINGWGDEALVFFDELVNNAGMLQKVQILITLLIFGLIGVGLTFLIKVVLFGRMFEIAIYSAISPLPLSTITFDTVKDTGVRFTKNYFSVILQGGFIVLIYLINAEIKTRNLTGLNDDGFVNYLLGIILIDLVTVVCLFKSGSWSAKIVGAN